MKPARFVVIHDECTDRVLVIRDVGSWDKHRTVTNDADAVVSDLTARGWLRPGRKLHYYDSDGELGELEHDGRGHFLRFCAVKKVS